MEELMIISLVPFQRVVDSKPMGIEAVLGPCSGPTTLLTHFLYSFFHVYGVCIIKRQATSDCVHVTQSHASSVSRIVAQREVAGTLRTDDKTVHNRSTMGTRLSRAQLIPSLLSKQAALSSPQLGGSVRACVRVCGCLYHLPLAL